MSFGFSPSDMHCSDWKGSLSPSILWESVHEKETDDNEFWL